MSVGDSSDWDLESVILSKSVDYLIESERLKRFCKSGIKSKIDDIEPI